MAAFAARVTATSNACRNSGICVLTTIPLRPVQLPSAERMFWHAGLESDDTNVLRGVTYRSLIRL